MDARVEILKYSIHKYSSFSSNYVPENIMNNIADDQSSRWSADSNSPPQFLTLKLDAPAIVQSITFGKYEKNHVCNLKKFIIYGGLDDENLIELLNGGLHNDNVPEKFYLKHEIDDNSFPCRFIKIVPIQSWGPSFNFSIWFVELHGVLDPTFVRPCMRWFKMHRDRQAIRLCLKYFRQHNYKDVFRALSSQTEVQLEHPLLTQLHESLVINGNFQKSEELIEQACEEGLFSNYIINQDYKPKWTPIEVTNKDVESRPGMRGGHQMCLDPQSEILYLFGGWDGYQDLADFWAYHVPTHTWNCLSKNTEDVGGPTARSCHKLCLDWKRKKIFLLGRYIDGRKRLQEVLKSDFYMYDIDTNKWMLITEDTLSMGGPPLIFDHQMVMDIEKHTMYVFGGRVLVSSDDHRSLEAQFSGLYQYYVPTNTWTLLYPDGPILRSRIGHSMLFHTRQRKLYVFTGQRAKEYLNDFFTYEVDTGKIYFLTDGSNKESTHVPASGFTQRATIDSETDEIHVLSGLSRNKDKKDNIKNSFWVYDIKLNRWSCIYRNENSNEQAQCWMKSQDEPVPRFAHQLVYDPNKKVHYLFGGNPGKEGAPKTRLDDFWQLTLCRPSDLHLMRRCKYLIRKLHYTEISKQSPMEALQFLQQNLREVVDSSDLEEEREFQLLASTLFKTDFEEDEMINTDIDTGQYVFSLRSSLFDTLSDFFPEGMTQPKKNLVDLISYT